METPHESRKYPRWTANQALRLEILGARPRAVIVTLTEVSLNGIRVRDVDDIPPGSPVAIQVEKDLLLGEIVWYSQGEAGIALEKLLDHNQLERIQRLGYSC